MDAELEKGKTWVVETLRTQAAAKGVPLVRLGHDYWWTGEGATTLRLSDKFGLPKVPFASKDLETVTNDTKMQAEIVARIAAVLGESHRDSPDRISPSLPR